MRRMWIPVLVAAALGLVSQSPAAAILPDPNQLACQVLPGNGSHPAKCGTVTASSSYAVDFTTSSSEQIVGWTFPQYTVIAGCVPGVDYCDLTVPAKTADQDVTVTVQYQMIATGGVRPALGFESASSATATIPAVCGRYLC